MVRDGGRGWKQLGHSDYISVEETKFNASLASQRSLMLSFDVIYLSTCGFVVLYCSALFLKCIV